MRRHRPLAVVVSLIIGTIALAHRPDSNTVVTTVTSAEEEVVQVRTTHPPSTTIPDIQPVHVAAPTTTSTTITTTTAPPRPVVAQRPAPDPPQTAGSDCGGWLDMIAGFWPADEVSRACRVMLCESGGNFAAENRRSSASGGWQFLASTWESVTGTPAPASAYSPEEQTAAAFTLWSGSGWRPWSCA